MAAVVGAGVVPTAHAVGVTDVVKPNPCHVGYAAPSGDAPVFYAAPSDPDLDVVHVDWQITATDVVVTVRVAELNVRPTLAWGEEFEAILHDRATNQGIHFGYFRTGSGGGPVFYGGTVPQPKGPSGFAWPAFPGGPTHLVADFDRTRSQVVLTLPRADLERALGVSRGAVVADVLGVNTYAMDPAYGPAMADFGQAGLDPTAASISFADCDVWLATNGAPVTAATPCTASLVAETGDERSRTGDVVPVRSDDLDVARVSYEITKTDLRVVVRVARLTDHPVDATGHAYTAKFYSHNTQVELGVVHDLVVGTKVRQYSGATVPTPRTTATLDTTRSLVTLVIPRAEIATAYGLPHTKDLVIANFGASSYWTFNGETASAADSDAYLNGAALSFADCDRYLRRGSRLALLTGTAAQYGDPARVGARLTDAVTSAPMVGKRVVFSAAGRSVAATTGADGVARASLAHGRTAGTYPLTASFAGDDDTDPSTVSATLTVAAESTRCAVKGVARSRSTRYVTVAVTDDDGAVVARQYVDFYAGGRRVATRATDGSGRATFTASAGQSVYAQLRAVTGRYLGCRTGTVKLR